MSISGTVQSNSLLAEPYLFATNKLYFSKPAGRTEADVLVDTVIVPKNIWGAPGTHQHDTQLSGSTNSLPLLFGSA